MRAVELDRGLKLGAITYVKGVAIKKIEPGVFIIHGKRVVYEQLQSVLNSL